MSPTPFARSANETALAAERRIWVSVGSQLRDARLAKGWTVQRLADNARISRSLVYMIEAGQPASTHALVRVGSALGLRLEVQLLDPRRRTDRRALAADIVHSSMSELEAAHLVGLGLQVGIDEPYQHYQYAGRADLVAWNLERKALLHCENRTRFPDLQDAAGSYNAKRAYLPAAMAERLEVRRWSSVTHAVVALWSSEVLHALRLRPASFRSLCPDPATAFQAWWAGQPPADGVTSTLVILDPAPAARTPAFADFDAALHARPRYRTYADAATSLSSAAVRSRGGRSER